jgi:hypothetical protein
LNSGDTKVLDSDIWKTDKSVCATEARFHAVAQTLLSVQIVKSNFAHNLIILNIMKILSSAFCLMFALIPSGGFIVVRRFVFTYTPDHFFLWTLPNAPSRTAPKSAFVMPTPTK